MPTPADLPFLLSFVSPSELTAENRKAERRLVRKLGECGSIFCCLTQDPISSRSFFLCMTDANESIISAFKHSRVLLYLSAYLDRGFVLSPSFFPHEPFISF